MEEVAQMMQDRNEALDMLKNHLVQAQNRMKQQADKHRRELEFSVGDKVYLKIQPYKLKKLANRVNQKLSPRYYGPYEVLERMGVVAYRLKLPEDSRVHPVFHVSLLKPTVTDEVVVQPLPAFVSEEMELQVQPEEILAMRKGGDQIVELLVKWKGLPDCENSWENMNKLTVAFPEFYLEDKVNLLGGSIDADPINEGQKGKTLQVYKRGERKSISWGPQKQARTFT